MANQTIQESPTLLEEGSVFEGDLRTDNEVHVSGHLIGTLEVKGRVVVAEGGTVEGEIIADTAEIAGRVEGEIYAEERLLLKETSRSEAEIEAARLVIEDGAQLTGQCKMGTSSEKAGADEENSGTEEISTGAIGRADSESQDRQDGGIGGGIELT